MRDRLLLWQDERRGAPQVDVTKKEEESNLIFSVDRR